MDRLLGDVVFRRAPIQSRLLHYLMERTISDPSPPTQFEIAVDGLGKTTEYDIENDSYPRVQVSRLKRNLQNYYARNKPGDGLKVELFDGSYRLRLVPDDAADNVATGEDVSGATDAALADNTKRKWLSSAVIVSAAIWVIGLAAIAFWYFGGITDEIGPEVPKTALILDLSDVSSEEAISPDVSQAVEQIGKIQLRNSLVSHSALPISNPNGAEYLVTFSSGLQRTGPAIFLTLYSSEGEVLYAHTISQATERSEDFENELQAALVFITSPTGAIAKNELQAIDNPTASEYSCFLSVENNRTREGTMSDLIDRCISRYPDSNYAAYWHARRAFALYQAAAANGEPIGKRGEAWAEVNKALTLGPTNAFANFVAAKVELASGRCEAARTHIDRALERGTSYPAMIASANADGAACPTSAENSAEAAKRLRALARYTPDPDPLLHLYLMLGLLAADDTQSASALAETLVISNPEGNVEQTSDLLRQALTNRAMARSNKAQLRSAIGLYVWNSDLADDILDRITG